MNKVYSRLVLALVLALVFGLALMPSAPVAEAGGPKQIPVSGMTFPNFFVSDVNVYFPDAGPNQIGNRDATGLIYPIVNNPFPFVPPEALVYLTDGLLGSTDIHERVVRVLADNKDPHRFTFKSYQTIEPGFDLSGNPIPSGVVIDGILHSGTFVQSLQGTGVLNEHCAPDPDPSDISDDYGDGTCAAASFSGTWTIKGNSGTGDLEGLRGSGTFEWDGVNLPTYEGFIHFAGGGANAAAASPTVLASDGSLIVLDEPPVFLPMVIQ